jgi:hypothetical protein
MGGSIRLSWGTPRATRSGFTIDTTYYEGDPDVDPPVTVTWESPDGLTWHQVTEDAQRASITGSPEWS